MTEAILVVSAASRPRAGPVRIATLLARGALLITFCGPALTAQAPDGASDDSTTVIRLRSERIARLDFAAHPSLAPSPDGRFIATLQTRPDPVLWIVPTDGGEPFAFRQTWAAYAPRWAPSGQRIGFIAGIGPPRIWTVEVDPRTGRPMAPPRLLYRTAANAFAFAPDGERLAFVPRRSTAAGASEVHIVEWESRRVRRLIRSRGLIYRLDWTPDGEWIYYGLAPDHAADSAHTVMRFGVQDRVSRPVMKVREFLGLSPDGAALLYRPLEEPPTAGRALAIAEPDGTPRLQVAVPKGFTPAWGATAATLVQLRRGVAGDELRTLSLPTGAATPQD